MEMGVLRSMAILWKVPSFYYDAIVAPWNVNKPEDITVESLQTLFDHAEGYDILIVGIGDKSAPHQKTSAKLPANMVLCWNGWCLGQPPEPIRFYKQKTEKSWPL